MIIKKLSYEANMDALTSLAYSVAVLVTQDQGKVDRVRDKVAACQVSSLHCVDSVTGTHVVYARDSVQSGIASFKAAQEAVKSVSRR